MESLSKLESDAKVFKSLCVQYKALVEQLNEMSAYSFLEAATSSSEFIEDNLLVAGIPSGCMEVLILLDVHATRLGLTSGDVGSYISGLGNKSVESRLLVLKKNKLVDAMGSFKVDRYVLSGRGKVLLKDYYRKMRKDFTDINDKYAKL